MEERTREKYEREGEREKLKKRVHNKKVIFRLPLNR